MLFNNPNYHKHYIMEVEIVATGGGNLSVIRGHPLKYPYHLPAISGAIGRDDRIYDHTSCNTEKMPGNDAGRCNTAQKDSVRRCNTMQADNIPLSPRALLTN